ncbi:MAG: zeta toxin family protein, partial [Janthinobacterium lividum]
MAIDPTPMTAEEQKAHAARLMVPELAHSTRVAHPHAILTGGQPGSGKSRIVNMAGAQLEGQGGAVVIDPDAIRPTLPYMKERIAAGDLDVPDAANIDAGTIAYQMVQIAKAEGRNVIVDGTLQNTARALDLATELRVSGYAVEFHGMAISAELSHARTYNRREDQIANSPTGFGRGVSDKFHAQAVKGYAATVEAFQERSAVYSMSLYFSDGAKAETKFENGAWVPDISMKEKLAQAQQQPSPDVIKATAMTWQVADDAMRARQAPADEQAKVDAFLAIASAKAASLSPAHTEASTGATMALDPLTRRKFVE